MTEDPGENKKTTSRKVVSETVHFVVLGGGSSRLRLRRGRSFVEDANTSVTLLEARGIADNLIAKRPYALSLMISSKLNNWQFETVP